MPVVTRRSPVATRATTTPTTEPRFATQSSDVRSHPLAAADSGVRGGLRNCCRAAEAPGAGACPAPSWSADGLRFLRWLTLVAPARAAAALRSAGPPTSDLPDHPESTLRCLRRVEWSRSASVTRSGYCRISLLHVVSRRVTERRRAARPGALRGASARGCGEQATASGAHAHDRRDRTNAGNAADGR